MSNVIKSSLLPGFFQIIKIFTMSSYRDNDTKDGLMFNIKWAVCIPLISMTTVN